MKIIIYEARPVRMLTGWEFREREIPFREGATYQQAGEWQIKAVEVHAGPAMPPGFQAGDRIRNKKTGQLAEVLGAEEDQMLRYRYDGTEAPSEVSGSPELFDKIVPGDKTAEPR